MGIDDGTQGLDTRIDWTLTSKLSLQSYFQPFVAVGSYSGFKEFKPLDVAGPLSVAALKANKVNCANLFSTQSAIPANGFITLEDPKHLAQTEAVVPLIAKSAATSEVSQVLNDVSSKLTTDNLVDMVKRVEVDKDDAATVADDFLSKNGLK